MAIMTVLIFNRVDGANKMLATLEQLPPSQMIPFEEAAVVRWEPGAPRPETFQVPGVTGSAPRHAFWVLLFGTILFLAHPITLATAIIDMLRKAFPDFDFDDSFIKRMRTGIADGTSALFLPTRYPIIHRVSSIAQTRGLHCTVITTPAAPAERRRAATAMASPRFVPDRNGFADTLSRLRR
jgi:uncharacterized membrane protein